MYTKTNGFLIVIYILYLQKYLILIISVIDKIKFKKLKTITN